MPDEIVCVAAGTPLFAQPVLQWRQRTVPTAEFDEDAPEDGGQMKPDRSRPFQRQQSAEQNEKDEDEMQHEYRAGQDQRDRTGPLYS